MNFVPHKYQQYAIDKIINEPSVGLLLDMGLGKTVITLTAILDLIVLGDVTKVLVIAPLQTARNTWGSELSKWDHLSTLRMSLILGSAKERRVGLESEADIYVINRENIQWLCDEFEDDWPFDMLVIDELSSFKNPSAKRFKALRKKMPFVKRVVGLTGTPASNGYMDLWSEVYLLDRGARLGKTIGSYRRIYFTPGSGNGYITYEWDLRDGAKEAIDSKLSDICISMKAVDYLDMPKRVEIPFFVEMDEPERKLYDEFGRRHILTDKNIVGVTAATVQNKLLQIANGFAYADDGSEVRIHTHKLEALSEIAEAANGSPLLVYYTYQADKGVIMKKFPEARELKGSKEVKDWNAGKIKMLVAHPASAGHGLNLQAGGHIIVWYGLPWSLELFQQANARLYRQGQTETVYQYYILTRDTHDEDVLEALKTKDQTQETLLGALKARIERWQNR